MITAKVTKDGKTVIKTFLLIIAREDASKNETRSATERTASVQAGENADGETETIYRTTMDDGTNIDYVTVAADTVQRLIESGATAENVVVRMIATRILPRMNSPLRYRRIRYRRWFKTAWALC